MAMVRLATVVALLTLPVLTLAQKGPTDSVYAYSPYGPTPVLKYANVSASLQIVASGAKFQHKLTVSDVDTWLREDSTAENMIYGEIYNDQVGFRSTIKSGVVDGGVPSSNWDGKTLTQEYTINARANTTGETLDFIDTFVAVDLGSQLKIHDGDGKPVLMHVSVSPTPKG